jgi:sialidase-1
MSIAMTIFPKSILRASAVFLSLASVAHAAAPPADIERTTVFAAGADGYHTYRIPAAIVTKAGTVLAFAEGRKAARGDSGNIDLLLKRSTDGGKSFGTQQIVWDNGDNTCGNPCPVIDEASGRIILLMTHNLGADKEPDLTIGTSTGTRTVWLTASVDDGVTWSPPREITKDVSKPNWTWYATGPGVGIQLKHGAHKGRLVIPCDHVIKPGGLGTGNAHVIFSDDAGATWKRGGEPSKNEFNESQVVELAGGKVMLNMRNFAPAMKAGAAKQRGVCISDDGGETFRDLRRDPTLIEPLCQASILRYDDERILFANPASEKREKMTVRVSTDDGATWRSSRQIFAGPSAYCCLVALPGEMVGLLYECGTKNAYERIEFARFGLERK